MTSCASKAHSPCTSIILYDIHLLVCFFPWTVNTCVLWASITGYQTNQQPNGKVYVNIMGCGDPSPLLFSCSALPNSLWSHGLQHTRFPCPSLSPRVCSNLCPLSQWFHPTTSSSITLSSPALNLAQHQGLFQWVDSSIRWPKYWSFSFSINPSKEYPEFISFRINS